MKRILVLVVTLAFFAPAVLANVGVDDMMKKDAKASMVTIKGYLIDRHCASQHMDALEATAMGHTTECTMKCMESGLGVATEGKWIVFDKDGQAKAAKLLRESKSEKGVMVQITGTIDGDKIVVSTIKEVSPAM